MESSCSDYFSVWDLEGYSCETEVTQSTHCLPNRVKFGLMLFWLLVHTLLLATLIVYLTREWRTTPRWTLQKRSLFILSICTTGTKGREKKPICCSPIFR